MKILNCVSRSVIFWKILSCDKKFLFPKRLIDLLDVQKIVPNKGEPIIKISDKFSTKSKSQSKSKSLINFLQVLLRFADTGYFSFAKIRPKFENKLCSYRNTMHQNEATKVE